MKLNHWRWYINMDLGLSERRVQPEAHHMTIGLWPMSKKQRLITLRWQPLLLFWVGYHKGYSEMWQSLLFHLDLNPYGSLGQNFCIGLELLVPGSLCHPFHTHPICTAFFHQCQVSARTEDTWHLCRNGVGSPENSPGRTLRKRLANFTTDPLKRYLEIWLQA